MKIFKNPYDLRKDTLSVFNDFDVATTRLFLFHMKLITLIRCQYHKEPYPPDERIDIDELYDISINDDSIAMAIFPSTNKKLYERSKESTGDKLFQLYNLFHLNYESSILVFGSCRGNNYSYLL